MPDFDPTKPVQTTNGWKARIICVDRNKRLPIVALVTDPTTGEEELYAYAASGKYSHYNSSHLTLVNVPERETWYATVYYGDDPYFGSVYQNVSDAKYARTGSGKIIALHYEDNELAGVEMVE